MTTAVATVAIRRATQDDVPALVQMLGRAFLEDPVITWACKSLAVRPALIEAIDRVRVRQILAYNEIWITPRATSAALWTPPGQGRAGLFQNVALAKGLLRPCMAIRLPKLALGLVAMQKMHFDEPRHWYLARLGTDPSVQGRGLGSSVLQPVLDLCDSHRTGAYLETARRRNLSFYSRHGFRVYDQLRLPGGPRIWAMWREPQSTSC